MAESTGDDVPDNGKTLDNPWPRGVSSLQYLRIAEASGELGFWSYDLTSGDVVGSPGFHWIHGSSPTTFRRAIDAKRFVHPDDWDDIEQMQILIVGGQAAEREFRVVRPDGSVRWVFLKGELMPGSQPPHSRVVGLIADVTKRRDALVSLQHVRERYRAVAAVSRGTVWFITANGWLADADGWEALTGQPRANGAGDGWLGMVHDEDRPRALAAWRAAQKARSPYRVEARLHLADGAFHPVDMGLAPLLNADGSLREWIGVCAPRGADQSATAAMAPAAASPVHGSAPGLTSAAIRGARGMLNWSIPDLAKASGVSASTVKRLEAAAGEIGAGAKAAAVRDALEMAGVEFLLLEDGRTAQALRR